MRGHRHPISGCYGYGNVAINNITNNTTNITNTYVTQVVAHGGSRQDSRPHKRYDHPRDRPHERKPELLRYCGSLGLLDGDKVARMSDDQFLDGALDVCSYAARGMGNDIHNMGQGISQMAEGVVGLGRCAGRLLAKIFG